MGGLGARGSLVRMGECRWGAIMPALVCWVVVVGVFVY